MVNIFVINNLFLLLFTGSTQVWHNLEQDHYVTGHEDPGSYVKNITYSTSLEQVIALVDNSISCKQYIRLKCFGSLFRGLQGEHRWYHWWQNRHSNKMYNWGAPKGTEGCACSTRKGMSRECKITVKVYK